MVSLLAVSVHFKIHIEILGFSIGLWVLFVCVFFVCVCIFLFVCLFVWGWGWGGWGVHACLLLLVFVYASDILVMKLILKLRVFDTLALVGLHMPSNMLSNMNENILMSDNFITLIII